VGSGLVRFSSTEAPQPKTKMDIHQFLILSPLLLPTCNHQNPVAVVSAILVFEDVTMRILLIVSSLL
jgi:hypothetical protein